VDSLIDEQKSSPEVSEESFPISRCYSLIFQRFLDILKHGSRHQSFSKWNTNTTADLIDCHNTKQRILKIASTLSNTPKSLTARIWSLVKPNEQTDFIEKRNTFSIFHPERLFFDQAHTAINDLENLQTPEDLPRLEEALRKARYQGAVCWAHRLAIQILIIYARDPKLIHSYEQTKTSLFARGLKTPEVIFFLHLLDCSVAYKTGNKKQFLYLLKSIKQHPYHSTLAQPISIWSKTASGQRNCSIIDGYSLRLTYLLFMPTLERIGPYSYIAAGNYRISLFEKPILNKLLEVLIRNQGEPLHVEDLLQTVWGHSTNLEGWKQKIRNAISRLRYEFRFLMIPIFHQKDGYILLSNDLKIIKNSPNKASDQRAEFLLAILEHEQLTAREIAVRTKIPYPTVMRIVRKKASEGLLEKIKYGKSFTYRMVK
jgi:DNA-binding winged helix-turn-helix (wHTH) protein